MPLCNHTTAARPPIPDEGPVKKPPEQPDATDAELDAELPLLRSHTRPHEKPEHLHGTLAHFLRKCF